MKKTKKDLFEENEKLKDILKSYINFWEVENVDEYSSKLKLKRYIYIVGIIGAFLLGLSI